MYNKRHFRVTLNKPYKKTTNICELSLANCMDFFCVFNFCVKLSMLKPHFQECSNSISKSNLANSWLKMKKNNWRLITPIYVQVLESDGNIRPRGKCTSRSKINYQVNPYHRGRNPQKSTFLCQQCLYLSTLHTYFL